MLQPDADLTYDVPSPVSSEAIEGRSGATDTEGGGEDELERGAERRGGEESAGPSGTIGRGSTGRATERRESAGPAYLYMLT